jgi:phage tail tape-measure protein
VTDFLEETHREITDRLKQLEPLVKEFDRLQAAAAALAEAIGSVASEATSIVAATVTGRRRRGRPPGRKKVGRPKTKKVGRPPGSATKAAASTAVPAAAAPSGAGRRKGSGKRSKQAVRLVRKQPGITIPELAAEMKINANYLYRILPGLEQEGKIRKEGRGWYPVEG